MVGGEGEVKNRLKNKFRCLQENSILNWWGTQTWEEVTWDTELWASRKERERKGNDMLPILSPNCEIVAVRVIWLRHLSPLWWPGLIRLIWLARQVSFPPSLLHVRPSWSCVLGQRGWPSGWRGTGLWSRVYE